MKTKDIIKELNSLPVEDRILVVDSLLMSLNNENKSVENKWIKIAEKRLNELQSGKTVAVSGKVVFEKIQKRFSK